MTSNDYQMIAGALKDGAPLHQAYNLLRHARVMGWRNEITRWIAGEILLSIEMGRKPENQQLLPVLESRIAITGINNFAHHGWWERIEMLPADIETPLQGDIFTHQAEWNDDLCIVTDLWIDEGMTPRKFVKLKYIGTPTNPDGWRFCTPADIAGMEIPTFTICTYCEDRTLYFHGKTPPKWARNYIEYLRSSREDTRLDAFEEETIELTPVYGGKTQVKTTTIRVVTALKKSVSIKVA